jgi:hypothetical protein
MIASALRQEQELAINIRKATSIEETAPKRRCGSAVPPAKLTGL